MTFDRNWLEDKVEPLARMLAAEKMGLTKDMIGEKPLPKDIQKKLGEFLDWLDVNYETTNGTTELGLELSQTIAERLV